MTGLQPAGFPHSDISGSIPVCRSPELIAAYHVLHRFRKPRHPPFALVLFLVLISESFATFTSQIYLLVLPYEIAVPISQLEKTRICYSYTDYNLFLTSYLVISLSIVNELLHIHSCADCIRKKTVSKVQGTSLEQPRARVKVSLQKGGVPATPSGTATLLRLSPNYQFCPRSLLAVTNFRHPRLSWLDGRCVQGPGTYSPRHG